MDNKPEVEEYATYFIKRLGEFVGAQKIYAHTVGLIDAEIKAVHARAFQLLGQHAQRFEEEAGLN